MFQFEPLWAWNCRQKEKNKALMNARKTFKNKNNTINRTLKVSIRIYRIKFCIDFR